MEVRQDSPLTQMELSKTAEYGTRGEPADSETARPGPKGSDEGSDSLPGVPGTEGQTSPVEMSDKGEEETGGKATKNSKKKKAREAWDNKFQFILTLIGYAVGLGNVWRFSYLVAKNGGSAFLIPYLVMLLLLGIPGFYLELLVGQGVRMGPVGVWLKLVPNLAGIGIASVIVVVYISIYYNVIIAWVIFYFFNSFQNPLVWAKCFGYLSNNNQSVNSITVSMATANNFSNPDELAACLNKSTEFFWYETAVQASSDISRVGGFDWRLFLCLLAAWVIIYFCLFKGIKWSGKIVYFSATFPYVVLVALFFRAVTLPGAGTGLKQLFVPGGNKFFREVFDPQVWLEAASQIFFSLGVGSGALIALSSYTKPHYNALKDTLIVCFTNSVTSIFASIIVFSIIGFKAQVTGETIDSVTQGPGLAFIVFTEALANMPIAPFWALLFFIMLFLLGLDSQFGALESFITVLRDIKQIRKMRKELVVGVICIGFYIVSIPFVLGNGIYLFQLFDQFAGTLTLLVIGFFEFICIGWVYGVERFFQEVAIVNPGRKAILLWTVLWKYVNPVVMFVIFVGSIVVQLVNPLRYQQWRNFTVYTVEYPGWARFIGSVIVISSLGVIPVWMSVRIALFKSARTEAMDFLRSVPRGVQNRFSKTVQFLRSVRLRRRLWEPQVDEESTGVPYMQAAADGVDGYGSRVSGGAELESTQD